MKINQTVKQFCDERCLPVQRVRQSIRDGFLTVDRKKRPMLILEGDVALTMKEWERQVAQACVDIPKGNWGIYAGTFEAADRLGNVVKIEFSRVPSTARRHIEQIKQWARRFAGAAE